MILRRNVTHTLAYKRYLTEVTIDGESGLLFAETIGMRDGVTAQAETYAALKQEFATSIEDYLSWCAELGEKPEKPYPGKFQLRTNPQIHRDAVLAAKKEGKSLNAFVNEALVERLQKVP
ncbi:MAG: type II toxin-antitoxin system HicB family antitoxin [Cyanobacteria bacterium J06639_1]